jgi:hypothetical protein
MTEARRRLVFGLSVLLFVTVSSYHQSAADRDLSAATTAMYPAVVTGARWLADRAVSDLEGGGGLRCRCSEPGAIAREIPKNPCASRAAVCLSTRGLLIARMSVPLKNGPGADLLVYEWGSQCGGTDDGFSVSVSQNGHQWILVAEAIHNDPDRPYASIDLGDERDDYLFVKIVPATAGGLAGVAGPEILGIEAVYPSVDFGW